MIELMEKVVRESDSEEELRNAVDGLHDVLPGLIDEGAFFKYSERGRAPRIRDIEFECMVAAAQKRNMRVARLLGLKKPRKPKAKKGAGKPKEEKKPRTEVWRDDPEKKKLGGILVSAYEYSLLSKEPSERQLSTLGETVGLLSGARSVDVNLYSQIVDLLGDTLREKGREELCDTVSWLYKVLQSDRKVRGRSTRKLPALSNVFTILSAVHKKDEAELHDEYKRTPRVLDILAGLVGENKVGERLYSVINGLRIGHVLYLAGARFKEVSDNEFRSVLAKAEEAGLPLDELLSSDYAGVNRNLMKIRSVLNVAFQVDDIIKQHYDKKGDMVVASYGRERKDKGSREVNDGGEKKHKEPFKLTFDETLSLLSKAVSILHQAKDENQITLAVYELGKQLHPKLLPTDFNRIMKAKTDIRKEARAIPLTHRLFDEWVTDGLFTKDDNNNSGTTTDKIQIW